MLRLFILIITILSWNTAIAAIGDIYTGEGYKFKVESEQATKMGLLQVMTNKTLETQSIYLNSKSIDIELSNEKLGQFIEIRRIDYIDNNMVLLVHHHNNFIYGLNKLLFLTITPDEQVIQSESFPFSRYEQNQSIKTIDKQIIVDMNIPADTNGSEIYRKAVYENGKITIEKSKPTNEDSIVSCEWMYELYLSQYGSMCSTANDVCHGIEAGCGYYLDKSVFTLANQALARACMTKRGMDMPSFKIEVCGVKSTENH